MEPLISVIVPIFRVEAYLRRCVDSILAQSYQNLEILLVDDGSDDGCPAICDAYAEQDARVRVIHKKNGGLSDARNAGIDVATGDYFGFVDSDDYIHPDMFLRLVEKAMETGADLVRCGRAKVDAEEQILEQTGAFPNQVLTQMEALNYMIDSHTGATVGIWLGLYRRELFDGLRFPVGRIHEDEYLTPRLLLACQTVSYIDDVLYYYNQGNGDSIMRRAFSPKRLDLIWVMEDRLAYFKQLDHPEIYQKTEKRFCQNLFFMIRQMIRNPIKNRKYLWAQIKKLHQYRNDFLRNPYISAKQKMFIRFI